MKLYVGNLPFSATEVEVRIAFEEYGSVEAVSIITDRDSGRAKGFGFVEMSDDNNARTAIDKLNGTQFGNRSIVVNEARPREERSNRNRF